MWRIKGRYFTAFSALRSRCQLISLTDRMPTIHMTLINKKRNFRRKARKRELLDNSWFQRKPKIKAYNKFENETNEQSSRYRTARLGSHRDVSSLESRARDSNPSLETISFESLLSAKLVSMRERFIVEK